MSLLIVSFTLMHISWWSDSLNIWFENFLLFCSTATNVEIELPVPADASNPTVRTSLGSAAYAPEKDALVWKIKSFPGNKVHAFFLDTVETISHLVSMLTSRKTIIGVYVEGRVPSSQYNCRRSNTWAKSSYPCQIRDPLFHCLRDSGKLVCFHIFCILSTHPNA